MTIAEREERLREIYRERQNKTLYIAGDGALRYGEIVVGVITEGMRRSGR